jgi:hypothetical protein
MKTSKFLSLALGFLMILSLNCTKDESNPDPATSPCCQNSSMSMETSDWQFFSEQSLDIKSPGTTTYEKTADGIKLHGQAYRLGSRLSTPKDFCVKNTTLRVKWKANGGGAFADYRVSLYYDKLGYGGDDTKRIDFTSLSTFNTDNGSVLIQNDVWYYTRVRIIEGSATAYTATTNYDDQGGQIIQTRQTTITGVHAGYLAARMGDPFGGTGAYMVVNEYKISSN